MVTVNIPVKNPYSPNDHPFALQSTCFTIAINVTTANKTPNIAIALNIAAIISASSIAVRLPLLASLFKIVFQTALNSSFRQMLSSSGNKTYRRNIS